ncbi:hypothetical protein SLEP1_g11448 [Rubroshorea leprosula]|uniref:EGF-like domain-containing protein n=1 Tax=Rubroshorea leprosula TaxID=152421 RepID=A0AAV5IM30_9ROSI|nr:hypothetical protein SLEP1_g11448 [Rubroshorea leprosula]
MGILERFWLVILIAAPLAAIVAEPAPIAKDDCPDRCGNVSIPYPFGTREGCSYNEDFLISCNDTSSPPLAFLAKSNISVTNITLEGRTHITQFIAKDCYNAFGVRINNNYAWLNLDLDGSYTISETRNKFVAIGCDTVAFARGFQGNKTYTTGCITQCSRTDYVASDKCSGIGCCQTSIPTRTNYIEVAVTSYYSHTGVWNFSPCSYGFIVEESKFNFSSNLLLDLRNVSRVPMVLDWSIREKNHTCKTEKANACQRNSECVPIDDDGYRCKCLKGFEGNPYLDGGCQDIDECVDPNLNDCKGMATCINTEGSHTCLCPKGYDLVNGTEQGCVANNRHNWNLILVPAGKYTYFNPLPSSHI